MLIDRTRALFQPDLYHGWGRRRKYFEGWYFKLVNVTQDRSLAVIPGIAMDEKGKKQAFIQVLDAEKKLSEYHSFSADEFQPNKKKFYVEIEKNVFSTAEIQLNLPDLKGKIEFDAQVKWPNKWYSPGIMGPFAFTPRMECYHGVVSMNHNLNGNLLWKGEQYDFTGGKGYIEKDWGHSFPSAYTWIQCNHFKGHKASLIATVAKIPWMGSSFVGFIAGLWFDGKLIQFTTYNFSKLKKAKIDQGKVEVCYENSRYRLEIWIQRDSGAQLAAPIGGLMDARISETMTAQLEVTLFDKKKKVVVFHEIGKNVGLEVAGKIEDIQLI